MHTLTYSAARAHLSATMDRVVNDHEAVIITRGGQRAPVVMVSLADYQAMQETTYLLRNPHNAAHLVQSLAQIEAGQVVRKTLIELDALAQ